MNFKLFGCCLIMWPHASGHLEPPPSSPLPEVLPVRNTSQITGPFYFGPPWVSSERYIVSANSSIPPQLQIQPSFRFPLEPRSCRLSRTRQRIHATLRRQPYRVSAVRERNSRRRLLPEWTEEEENLPMPVSSGGSANETRQLRILVKRQDRGTCICTPCNVSLTQQNGSHSLLSSEETQLLPSDHWIRTPENQPICRLQGTSLLSRNFLINPGNNQNISENRTASSPISDTMVDRRSFSPPDTAAHLSNSLSNTESVVTGLFHSDPQNSHSHISEQSTRVSEKSESELSNHDRTAVTFSVSSLLPTGNSTISPTVSCQLSTLTMPSAQVHQVTNRVIKHARHNKIPSESSMWCPDCGLFPTLPVTGQCGHTRCTKCIQVHGSCPCGAREPKNLHVNTLIQGLIKKLLPDGVSAREPAKTSGVRRTSQRAINCKLLSRLSPDGVRVQRRSRGGVAPAPAAVPAHTPMAPQTRYEHAQKLVMAGRHLEAVPHLARVAASSEPLARVSRSLLAQCIAAVSRGRDPRRLTRLLYRAVRRQAASTWLRRADLECVLCYHTYTAPVTTPCGHTYCRTCIERSMDYRKACALCLRPLNDFNLAATHETVFISAALDSIDALKPPIPPEPDVIPIFVCTVAFPAIPCPLFIFDPRYWLMIRRVLESGSRKFGMVAYERDRSYSDYGTVLEVCDCVHLEDGRSILSTIGVSRFKVIERDVRDGCDVARIQPLADIMPTDELVIWDLRIMATQISYKALLWLNRMNKAVRLEIETAFGQLPRFDHRGDWWEGADGPAWLWWLIAILPLRSEIKVLILSTKNLLKRMMAVSRTLEAIDHVNAPSTECALQNALTNAEEWLRRSP